MRIAAEWLVLAVALPGVAHAHPVLDEARGAYESAAFARALELLVEAESASDLTRDDVEDLLLLRATVHYAMGHEAEWRADVERLARLDPGFAMGAEQPPRLREAFDAARGEQLALEVSAERVPGAVEVSARVTGDPGGLVRRVETGGSRAGAAESPTTGEARVRIAAAASETVEYWAQVIGPGGAVLLARGSEADPLRLAPEPARAARAPTARSPAGAEEDGGASWVVWTGVGAAAVAAAIVAVVLVASMETETQLSSPEVRGP